MNKPLQVHPQTILLSAKVVIFKVPFLLPQNLGDLEATLKGILLMIFLVDVSPTLNKFSRIR